MNYLWQVVAFELRGQRAGRKLKLRKYHTMRFDEDVRLMVRGVMHVCGLGEELVECYLTCQGMMAQCI